MTKFIIDVPAWTAKVRELVDEALAEDKREGGRFDREGWANFFPEDLKANPAAVEAAWQEYNSLRDSGQDES